MGNARKLEIATANDRDIVFTRSFDAPRALVFDAWTKPELVRRWLLGPPGWTMPVCEIDLRVGGRYRYVWRRDDGVEMGMGGVHLEVVVPERVVCTQLFDQDWTGGEAVGTLEFTERGGVTTVRNTVRYASTEARESVLRSGAAQGMEAGYERLDDVLAGMGGVRAVGDFCWINILTPRPEAARAFFGKLLGWTFTEIPGMGHCVKAGGRDIGGLFDLEGPNTPPGTPPIVGVMVKVASADATAAKVAALGGRAMPAFDIGEQGRMAVCFDPDGAEFDVWEPRKMAGTDAAGSLPGAPSWFEVMTSDAARAASFYAALFGWSPQVVQMPGHPYTTFRLGDDLVAGAMQISPAMGSAAPRWVTYFTVRDADEAARTAAELGGQVTAPPADVPGVGRFCGITSPQGVTFRVLAYSK